MVGSQRAYQLSSLGSHYQQLFSSPAGTIAVESRAVDSSAMLFPWVGTGPTSWAAVHDAQLVDSQRSLA